MRERGRGKRGRESREEGGVRERRKERRRESGEEEGVRVR